MTYEEKAKEEMSEHENMAMAESAILLGMAYIADAVSIGLRRLTKVIDKISIEVQDDND